MTVSTFYVFCFYRNNNPKYLQIGSCCVVKKIIPVVKSNGNEFKGPGFFQLAFEVTPYQLPRRNYTATC